MLDRYISNQRKGGGRGSGAGGKEDGEQGSE